MVFSSFWKNSQKLHGGFECATRRRMSDNSILGFFCDEPPSGKGDSARRCKHCAKNDTFRTFRAARTTRRKFYITRHQALQLWALGAIDFTSLCSFRKTAFSDSLTVRFRWNCDKRFITCCYSLWTVEIRIGYLHVEIYITLDWLFSFPNSMTINGWLSVLKCWYDLDW